MFIQLTSNYEKARETLLSVGVMNFADKYVDNTEIPEISETYKNCHKAFHVAFLYRICIAQYC